jgi:hypothetical protein
MSENGVTIPLPEIANFEDRIIEAAARQLLSSVSYDEDGDERRYRSELGRKIEAAMVETIREQAREAAPDVARSMLEQGVPRTDRWGDSTHGTPMSLRAVIGEEVKANLVADNGHRGPGVLRQIISSEVEKAMRAELAQVVADAKKPVLDAVRKEAAGAIEKALANALKGIS